MIDKRIKPLKWTFGVLIAVPVLLAAAGCGQSAEQSRGAAADEASSGTSASASIDDQPTEPPVSSPQAEEPGAGEQPDVGGPDDPGSGNRDDPEGGGGKSPLLSGSERIEFVSRKGGIATMPGAKTFTVNLDGARVGTAQVLPDKIAAEVRADFEDTSKPKVERSKIAGIAVYTTKSTTGSIVFIDSRPEPVLYIPSVSSATPKVVRALG